MNVEEHHLIMLMEECAEAAQRASKQLRFGRDEVQPGQDMPNHRRLRDEILDVLAVVGRLQEENLIDTITHSDVMEHRRAKQAKVDRMMALSRAQGRLAVETSELPEHLRDPFQVIERGNQILKEWGCDADEAPGYMGDINGPGCDPDTP